MKKQRIDHLQSSLKLLVKTSAIVFIGVMISKLLGYAYRIVVARYFGPEVYGLFSLALMISGWFIAISALGLNEGLLRFIPNYRGKKDQESIKYIFKFSAWTVAITSIISGFLLFMLSDYIALTFFREEGLIIFLKIFSIVVPISVLGYPFLASIRAHEEISWYSFIYNIAQNAIKVFALIVFIILGMNSDAVSFSYLAGIFGMLIMAYFVCKYKIPYLFGADNLSVDKERGLRKELMSYSLPLLFYGIVSMIFYWIDSFALGYYKSAFVVGLYNAAIPIAILLGVAPELFMQLFFPMINREYAKKNVKLIGALSKQVAKWILLVNIPLFAIMLVFPGAVINLFFGTEYLAAENALRILSVGALFSSIFIISNNLIQMTGRSGVVLTNIVIAAAINLVLNIDLVPMQQIGFIDNSTGMNGAAIATVISVIIFNMLFMAGAYRYLKIIPLRRKMITLFLIAMIPAALLFYLRTIFVSNSLIVLAGLFAVFMLVYILLILVAGVLDENDWGIINKIYKKLTVWKR